MEAYRVDSASWSDRWSFSLLLFGDIPHPCRGSFQLVDNSDKRTAEWLQENSRLHNLVFLSSDLHLGEQDKVCRVW
jgi:hypothetical protein